MKRLPIGIQNLEEIITENYYYVDKTKFVYDLFSRGKYYFLSRPRRFGKSLFVDTLKQAFLGNKELFKGLFLENNWNWNKQYPVIHIDFGTGVVDKEEQNKNENLKDYILKRLKENAKQYQVEIKEEIYYEAFRELIISLNAKYNERVVILIDEYDKPILDRIEDKEEADRNREILRSFYSVIKSSDSYLKFVFITGVTKFNKVSIFSGLNQLDDISIDKRYSAICGYTEEELINVFADRIKEFNLQKVRYWYNGYNWRGESVYNPFDVLLFLSKKDFQPYWFATGTATFLMKLIKEKRYYLPQIENIKLSDSIMDSFDVEDISIENLLFQTGYLTIKGEYEIGGRKVYQLDYPNFEVKVALNDHLLQYLTDKKQTGDIYLNIFEAFASNNLKKFEQLLKSFYASIPYEWYNKNELNKYEGYYASVFYSLIAGAGFDVKVEDSTNKGKVDLSIHYENKVYVIEFKVIKNETEKGSALKQIKESKYYEKYEHTSDKIYLTGIEFDQTERNIVNFEFEKYK